MSKFKLMKRQMKRLSYFFKLTIHVFGYQKILKTDIFIVSKIIKLFETETKKG